MTFLPYFIKSSLDYEFHSARDAIMPTVERYKALIYQRVSLFFPKLAVSTLLACDVNLISKFDTFNPDPNKNSTNFIKKAPKSSQF